VDSSFGSNKVSSTYDVSFFGHVTSKKKFFSRKNIFVQKVKVKGQSEGQGQMKVKGQGHVIFWYFLPFFIAVLMNVCKKFINALCKVCATN